MHLVEWLGKKHIPVVAESSIYEDGNNSLEDLTKYLAEGEVPTKKDKPCRQSKSVCSFFDDSEDEEEEKPVEHDYVIIFDDLSEEISNKYVTYLLKRNRHLKAKVLISSQWYNDLAKGARKQIDYFLIYPRFPLEKLEELRAQQNLDINKQTFAKIYKEAVAPDEKGKKSHNFLYIDVANDKFRKNFNQQFEIDTQDD